MTTKLKSLNNKQPNKKFVYYYNGEGKPEPGVIRHINKKAGIAHVVYGEIAIKNIKYAKPVPTDLDDLYVKTNNGKFIKFKNR